MTPAENSAEDADENSANPAEPVEYTATVAGHHVVVEIRHSVLDTTLARMWVDGRPALQKSENDAAREKARKRLAALDRQEAKDGELSAHDQIARRLDKDSDAHPWHGIFDSKIFAFRSGATDESEESEESADPGGTKHMIKVRLRSFGKTAEVTTFGAKPQFFVPTPGSASAARDAKQLANPKKFALRSAGLKAVAILAGLAAAWLLGRIVPWLIDLLAPLIPNISLPSIDIPFPDISLPSINLPSIDLPELPDWVEQVEPFIQPAILIIIAGVIALTFAKRKQKALAEREEKEGDGPAPDR